VGNITDLFAGLASARELSSTFLEGEVYPVGGIYQLDYDRALVLTNDRWKIAAGGIPQHCFLLATAKQVDGTDIDDDEVLLLRVEDTAQLAQERDLLATREQAIRERLLTRLNPITADTPDEQLLDPYTRDVIQFSGLDCAVLGTFYEIEDGNRARIDWGGDLDNLYASSRYQVYKPYGRTLSYIASYAKPDRRTGKTVVLGHVRYASTRRRALVAAQHDAQVRVNVRDFVGEKADAAKTAVFGMTRTGKSNTVKTIAAQVKAWAAENKVPIGQLLFDPAGEYANPNVQDHTALAAIGAEHVTIYRYGATVDQANVRALGINFYDPEQIATVQAILGQALASESADYVRNFLTADFEGKRREGDSDDEARQRQRQAQRAQFLLYATLAKAQFTLPAQQADSDYRFSVPLPIGAGVADPLVRAEPGLIRTDRMRSAGLIRVPGRLLEAVANWLLADARRQDPKATCDRIAALREEPGWRAVEPLYTQMLGASRVSGYTKLADTLPFHTTYAERDYADNIYKDLVAGKIVICDLHIGNETVVARMSERIIHRLLEAQNLVFTAGDDPPRLQVFVEEAHRLFDEARFNNDNGADPWVRLAKEGAKFNISLIYATQEVTGVDERVLKNTQNWVVAHLNNEGEVKELSKFYDFRTFARAIVKAEDKGLVRLKTASCPYIVPVQIRRFGADQVNEARAALGEPPLPPSDDGAPNSPSASNGRS
jgi:Helicase HerA, central domain